MHKVIRRSLVATVGAASLIAVAASSMNAAAAEPKASAQGSGPAARHSGTVTISTPRIPLDGHRHELIRPRDQ